MNSLLDKIGEAFDNPGKFLKTLAKICFYLCLIIAVILFIVGVVKIASAVDKYSPLSEVLTYTTEDYVYGLSTGYDWYVNGYMGKIQCKTALYLALSSLACFPLSALGCLVQDISEEKQKLVQINDNIEQLLKKLPSDPDAKE